MPRSGLGARDGVLGMRMLTNDLGAPRTIFVISTSFNNDLTEATTASIPTRHV
jgi:hypothetical protein